MSSRGLITSHLIIISHLIISHSFLSWKPQWLPSAFRIKLKLQNAAYRSIPVLALFLFLLCQPSCCLQNTHTWSCHRAFAPAIAAAWNAPCLTCTWAVPPLPLGLSSKVTPSGLPWCFMVKAPLSQCRGAGLMPSQGTWIPLTATTEAHGPQ